MLLDLVSTSNYAHYNIKLAQIIGLEGAVYVNELLNINEKAVRKSKLKEGAMKLKRSYITERTTFSTSKQLDIENRLVNIGLIIRDDVEPDLLSVDIGVLTGLVMAEDETLIKDISKLAKKKTLNKTIKEQEDIITLKQCVKAENEELRRAYYEWIDAAYMRSKYLSPKAVSIAQKLVDEFSNHDLDVALSLLEFAAMHGYSMMSNAVKRYKELNHQKQSYVAPAQLNIGVSSTILGDDVF